MIFFRQRKDVVNQLRQVNDEDWQVFNNELLSHLDDQQMDTSNLPEKKTPKARIYKDQVRFQSSMSVVLIDPFLWKSVSSPDRSWSEIFHDANPLTLINVSLLGVCNKIS